LRELISTVILFVLMVDICVGFFKPSSIIPLTPYLAEADKVGSDVFARLERSLPWLLSNMVSISVKRRHADIPSLATLFTASDP